GRTPPPAAPTPPRSACRRDIFACHRCKGHARRRAAEHPGHGETPMPWRRGIKATRGCKSFPQSAIESPREYLIALGLAYLHVKFSRSLRRVPIKDSSTTSASTTPTGQ